MENAKALCNDEMMLHELVAILPLCEQYAGTLQEPIPFKVSDETREAADYLAERYRLKIGSELRLIDYLRYARLYISLKLNRKRIAEAIDAAIWGARFDQALRNHRY